MMNSRAKAFKASRALMGHSLEHKRIVLGFKHVQTFLLRPCHELIRVPDPEGFRALVNYLWKRYKKPI